MRFAFDFVIKLNLNYDLTMEKCLRGYALRFRYHEANEKARAKVLELLRGLSVELQSKINVLVFASMMLVISKALFSHVRLGIQNFTF